MAEGMVDKKKRVRSPNYPAVDLEDALTKAKVFYNEEDRHQANIEVAAKHWGYKSAASGGALVIAALTSFGLMDDEGAGNERKVRLSPMGLRLVMDGSPSRRKDLELAALNPKIHQELWEKWGASLPSVESIRFYLLSERGFNRGTVDTFIEEYRHTLSFAGLLNDGKLVRPVEVDDLIVGFNVGDFVRWESQGIIQFEAKRVTGISEDYTHAFVEGTATGLPASQLTRVEPPAEKDDRGRLAPQKPAMENNLSAKEQSIRNFAAHQLNQEVFTTSTGDVVLQWPVGLNTDELEEFEIWLDLMKRKVKRAVRKKEIDEAE